MTISHKFKRSCYWAVFSGFRSVLFVKHVERWMSKDSRYARSTERGYKPFSLAFRFMLLKEYKALRGEFCFILKQLTLNCQSTEKNNKLSQNIYFIVVSIDNSHTTVGTQTPVLLPYNLKIVGNSGYQKKVPN